VVDLATNCFNAPSLGLQGFERLARLVDCCECHDFEYGLLDDAVAVFDTLAGVRG
jgi:hypothetical protein